MESGRDLGSDFGSRSEDCIRGRTTTPPWQVEKVTIPPKGPTLPTPGEVDEHLDVRW